MKDQEISLDFESNIQFTEFCAFVLSFLKKILKINEDDLFKVEISIREAINNAIIHGNKNNPQKRVFLKFEWNKKHIVIHVRDENPNKINFNKIKEKIKKNNILSFQGRGVLIIENYMDKVEFLYSKNGNEIVMEKMI